MTASGQTIHGLVIERDGDRLVLREPALGRNTVTTIVLALVGLGFVALGALAAEGLALVLAIVVGAALVLLGVGGLVSHLRGDGIVTVDLATGTVTQAGRTATPIADERPAVVVVHRHRHERIAQDSPTTRAVSWWHVELTLGDRRWRLQPAHRHRAHVDRMASAVNGHVGGTVGHRDETQPDGETEPDGES